MTGRSAWACVALILVVFEASLVLGEGEVGGSRPVREKRAPFSSWAGKRSSEEDLSAAEMAQLVHELEDMYQLHNSAEADDVSGLSKRAPFSSWAGNRAPFSSWAGKRAPFSSWAGKRAPFSSWAGKRSVEDDDQAQLAYLHQQQPAGHRYKRSSGEIDDDTESTRVRRGAGFSAWGGKRSLTGVDDEDMGKKRIARNTNAVEEGHKVVVRPARASFSAWGGR